MSNLLARSPAQCESPFPAGFAVRSPPILAMRSVMLIRPLPRRNWPLRRIPFRYRPSKSKAHSPPFSARTNSWTIHPRRGQMQKTPAAKTAHRVFAGQVSRIGGIVTHPALSVVGKMNRAGIPFHDDAEPLSSVTRSKSCALEVAA